MITLSTLSLISIISISILLSSLSSYILSLYYLKKKLKKNHNNNNTNNISNPCPFNNACTVYHSTYTTEAVHRAVNLILNNIQEETKYKQALRNFIESSSNPNSNYPYNYN